MDEQHIQKSLNTQHQKEAKMQTKILNAKIDWHFGYANYPTLEIEVEGMPDFDPMKPVWRKNENINSSVMYSNQKGIVNFISMTMDGKIGGFGGSEFRRTLEDGTIVISRNCWSSRAECVQPEKTFLDCDIVDLSKSSNCDVRSFGLHKDLFARVVNSCGCFLVPYEHDTINGLKTDFAISVSPDKYLKPNVDDAKYKFLGVIICE